MAVKQSTIRIKGGDAFAQEAEGRAAQFAESRRFRKGKDRYYHRRNMRRIKRDFSNRG